MDKWIITHLIHLWPNPPICHPWLTTQDIVCDVEEKWVWNRYKKEPHLKNKEKKKKKKVYNAHMYSEKKIFHIATF